jgi:hypothetical protein
MGFGWSFRDGDWQRLRQIIQKIGSIDLGPQSTPVFGGLTITGDTTIGGSLVVDGSLTLGGGISIGGTLNMNCNEIQNFIVHTVADGTAMGLLDCGQGQMCFRLDEKKFYGRLE